MTQSSLAALLSNRGPAERDKAERLYRAGLTICHEVRDLQDIAVFLMGLGQLAQVRGNAAEAIPLLQKAQQRFSAIGLPNWAASAAQLLAQAQGAAQGLTRDDE